MSNIDKQTKYESKFSRLWERYDEASHGNAEQMCDILEVTLDALESAERQILRLEKLADSESVGADKAAASCVEWMKRCHDANKRIAELEALTTTRLTQPAVNECAISCPAEAIRACMEEFPESVRDIVEECASIAENACRAAMLQGVEPVPATDNTAQQFEALASEGVWGKLPQSFFGGKMFCTEHEVEMVAHPFKQLMSHPPKPAMYCPECEPSVAEWVEIDKQLRQWKEVK